MSEADSPNRDSDVTESTASGDLIPPVDQQAAAPTPAAATGESWQTVDFPGAMSVDAIPQAEATMAAAIPAPDPAVLSALASLNEVPAPEPAAERSATDPQLAHHLQQENQELRDRLKQLEQDMAQQQIEFQLELARSLHSVSSATNPSPAIELKTGQELATAQERISQLFQELEFSQQTAQRQQILVETLTKQLESSQERIAQLERDCALGQQRYNEQIQQILQVENTCRDLRMRLHRQQQQTLQFKAALEKCLEVPAAYSSSHLIINPEQNINAAVPVVPTTSTALSQGLTPKNQPVRPWTVATVQAMDGIENNELLNLPKPLSKLINADATEGTDTAQANPSVADTDNHRTFQTADNLNQIFADAEEIATYPVAPDQTPTIFDVSPFLQTENSPAQSGVDRNTVAPSEQSHATLPPLKGDEALLQMLAAVPLDADTLGSTLETFWGSDRPSEDGLWNDLANLIDPPVAQDSPAPESDEGDADPAVITVPQMTAEPVSNVSFVPTTGIETSGIDSATTGVIASDNTTADKKPLELIGWASRSNRLMERERRQPVNTQPIMPVDANPTTPGDVPPEKPSDSPASGEFLTPSWPSPVVYPLRPAKKLNSLAAVELPTFPKAR